MKAEEEGWGDEFRTELFKRQWEELEDEARERELAMRRKKKSLVSPKNGLKQPDRRENAKACE